MKLSTAELLKLVFTRAPKFYQGDHSLDIKMFNIVLALDGERPLAEVARQNGFNPDTLAEQVNWLLDNRYIDSVNNDKNIDQDFVAYLFQHLSRAIGPIAEIVIDDTTEAMGELLSQFPIRKIDELIGLLLKEIRDEKKADAFKYAMVQKIKEKNY